MNTPKDEYWDSFYLKQSIDNIDKCDDWLDKYSNYFNFCNSVLDLGCGSGSNTEPLLQKCKKVYAADFSPPAIAILKEKYSDKPVYPYCFDMQNTFPFPDSFFNIVVADLSIHYFKLSDTKKILAEIKRVLVPKGILLARVHSIKNLPSVYRSTDEEGLVIANGFQRKYFTSDEIRSLLSGWQTIALKEETIHRFSKDKNIFEFAAEVIK